MHPTWGHLLQHWSQTQGTAALSSGEAELSGTCKRASKGIGLRSLMADLGLQRKLAVLTDATAAIGICRRRGLGKIRHLAVADLWIQDRVRSKDFDLRKCLGHDNPADMLTKHLDHPTLLRHLNFVNRVAEGGRPESAPALTH